MTLMEKQVRIVLLYLQYIKPLWPEETEWKDDIKTWIIPLCCFYILHNQYLTLFCQVCTRVRVCARVHTYTSVYVCVHLPVKGWFDDCVDRQSGREQAEEEALGFNIPLSSPDTDTGNMEGDAIVGHSLRATCHFPPYCCLTQVQPLK